MVKIKGHQKTTVIDIMTEVMMSIHLVTMKEEAIDRLVLSLRPTEDESIRSCALQSTVV